MPEKLWLRCAAILMLATAASPSLTPAAYAQMTPLPSDPVATHAGRVAGTRLASGVKAYLGLPYARPPVDELRWRAPQPTSWAGIFNADRKGPECIQILRPHNINHYFGEEATSENCLYMNVWTPGSATARSRLPVIVFIYGGGGTVGSSGPSLYGGEEVAKHGAVFVNFNYRVGILGFMAHPELTREQGGHSGNYGYLDQNAALRWIHDNISAFGGDPNKVLIAGQSFGAGSVAAQVASPMSRGLFRAAAMWSACSFDNKAVPLSEGEKVGLQIQQKLGVADLAAMRNVPADRILAVQEEHQLGADVHGVRLPSTVDGLFWTQPKLDSIRARTSSDVPIIASSNGDDLDSNRFPLTGVKTVAEFQATARKMFGADADTFLKLYPVSKDQDVRPMAHLAAEEGGFLEQSRRCAATERDVLHQNAYVDIFAHKHPYVPGVVIADQNTATIGAYHTSDVPYWFGTFDAFNMFRATRVWTEADRRLSEMMMGALIHMAETGSPSTPAFQWPAWSPVGEAYAEFDTPPKVLKMDAERTDWMVHHMPAQLDNSSSRSAVTRD